jgi:hypothetical protein
MGDRSSGATTILSSRLCVWTSGTLFWIVGGNAPWPKSRFIQTHVSSEDGISFCYGVPETDPIEEGTVLFGPVSDVAPIRERLLRFLSQKQPPCRVTVTEHPVSRTLSQDGAERRFRPQGNIQGEMFQAAPAPVPNSEDLSPRAFRNSPPVPALPENGPIGHSGLATEAFGGEFSIRVRERVAQKKAADTKSRQRPVSWTLECRRPSLWCQILSLLLFWI